MIRKVPNFIKYLVVIILFLILVFSGVLAYSKHGFSIDWVEFWNVIFFGMLASILGSIFVVIFTSWEQRMMFSYIQGSYKGYVFKKDEDGEETDLLDKEKQTSEAKIEQTGDNILSIEVRDLGHPKNNGEYLTWVGEMIMEMELKTSDEKFGTIVWRYKNLDESKERFGFKRCIVTEKDHLIKIYLIGEDGFGKEVLLKE